METAGIGAQGSTSSNPLTSGAASSLGKDDFMKLLIAQLGHQDPLNPTDNTAFVAQLAQFSALEQSMQTNTKLSNIADLQTSQLVGQSWNMIGKKVTAVSDTMSITTPGKPPAVQFNLAGPAKEVTAEIYDSNNNLLRKIDLGGMGMGAQSATWDGLDAKGANIPAGSYHVKITAKDAAGKDVDVSTTITGVVSGVDLSQGSADLLIDSAHVKMSSVLSVSM